MIEKIDAALASLRDKYGAPEGKIIEKGGAYKLITPDGNETFLLPWRVERRFVELKKIVDSGTLEGVSTFRFAAFRHGGDLTKMIAAELDLAAFIASSRVTGLCATRVGDAACNVIFRLENAMSGCVECGTGLPAGAESVDRHEIIARRGVASDRVVDTQVPQSSIYQWSDSGSKTYTDVDAELFGLPNEYIWIVRAAFAVLQNPSLSGQWNAAATEAERLGQAAYEAGSTGKKMTFEVK